MTFRKARAVETYRALFAYVRESRREIAGVAIVFVLSVFFGFIFEGHLGFLDEVLRALIEKTQDLSIGALMVFIFLNNVQSSLIGLVFGVVLGIFPVGAAAANGVVLGYVLAKSLAFSGSLEIWRLLPHGIFELPAVFLSLGMGTRLGFSVFARRPMREFARRAQLSALVFVCIVIPLLAIAAVIEGMLIALSV